MIFSYVFYVPYVFLWKDYCDILFQNFSLIQFTNFLCTDLLKINLEN